MKICSAAEIVLIISGGAPACRCRVIIRCVSRAEDSARAVWRMNWHFPDTATLLTESNYLFVFRGNGSDPLYVADNDRTSGSFAGTNTEETGIKGFHSVGRR